MKKALIITVISILSLPLFSFGPAAHYSLMKLVTDSLPSTSTIRQALLAYPRLAATGANGPDLGYGQPRIIAGYAPWADRFHYDKMGTMSLYTLQDALASGNNEKIAWAAGWLTHVMGDLACHGIYVNPEPGVGVYLDNPNGRDVHKELEKWSEPYVWYRIANLTTPYNNNNLPGLFDINDQAKSILTSSAWRTYGYAPSYSEIGTWFSLYKTVLSLGVAYSYTNLATAEANLALGNRKQRLIDAFNNALTNCVKLLTYAEAGDYSQFCNGWNLDSGLDGRPIGTLTVKIKTADVSGAGTDCDIYFGMQLANGTNYERLLDKKGYNDFERNDNDDYYLYVASQSFYPDQIRKIWLRSKSAGLGPDWKVSTLNIEINGSHVYSQALNSWINSGKTWTAYPVYFSAAGNRPVIIH
jgi:hypothetical protein